MNPLVELGSQKQSFWLDFIRRSLLTSGALKKMVVEDGLRGMTSNPTIFEKAISSGSEYDADLKKLALKGLSTEEIFENIAVKDIQMAADILKTVYKSSGGTDGFVSLEVNPDLAYNTQATVAQAKHLFKKVGRPNLMIKVPGTPAGLPAIEELIAAGININVTLLFSVENYKQVLEAYLKGLEKRQRKGLSVKGIASVASFFVSRVDTLVDKYLDQMISLNSSHAPQAKNLLHKIAVANAKLAYAHYEQVIQSDRFRKLEQKGAQRQRLLWASTGTKDKRLSDVIYVDELIGPDTVNTMPPQTVDAFRDHGRVSLTLRSNVDQAKAHVEQLSGVGIDLEKLLTQLQEEGVRSFIGSFETLLQVVAAKKEILTGQISKQSRFDLGKYQTDFQNTLQIMEQNQWIKRVWEKDASLWKSEEAHQKIIKNSLGWLTVPFEVKRKLALLDFIATDIKKAKFTHALLLGMGGSSLCPEVLRLTFGKKTGFPDLAILDSTEPASVLGRASRSKPEKTLYIVASKSGSTTEPNAFLAYFYDQVKKKKGERAGENFIAITDPGTQMERIAREKKFRHIVLNPADIGGRYSALSFFGMLPAALMGLDVPALLSSALDMSAACSPLLTPSQNPGALLGAALGSLAKAGRNKVTFFLSKDIASLSAWIEQLIAESTGKEGKGILPVESEPFISVDAYGSDRVFVALQTKVEATTAKRLAALKKAGHPVIQINMESKQHIAAEFFRWEFATAMAGAALGIDAFDQPNVQESKDLTREYLESFKSQGALTSDEPTLTEDGLSVYSMNGLSQITNVEELLRSLFRQVKAGDYVALLAYVERNEKHEKILQKIRERILSVKHVATTVGYGPRFLHSTGQLHKGGDDSGVFIQITAEDKKDVPIPGEPFGFSTLKEAQALGDLSALANKHRRAVRIHLEDADEGLDRLQDLIEKVIGA
ncbi:MAG: Transaldolase [Elusimicrobia bacterium]|nr:Transaldolase [Elusimicrobiota bacterium]